MSAQEVLYLKQNVVIEPLFNQWYAWSMLVPPQTAAMFTVHHVRMMKSYIMAPMAHAAAVRNPGMLGGPYLDYQGQRVEEIRGLLERTERELVSSLAFAAAVKELSTIIKNDARGSSMESLYQRIPAPLRGYVELVYDLQHHGSFRLIEALLYESDYFKPTLQSFSLSLTHHREHRAFVFSTPRLEDPEHFHLKRAFSHSGIDSLFEMREKPKTLRKIQECLELSDKEAQKLRACLTAQPSVPSQRFNGPGVRVRYMGHACLLIETSSTSILVDPCISYGDEIGLSPFTFSDLPETIDYVLITHGHQDHLLLEMLLQLRYKVKTVIVPRAGGGSLQDPSLKLLLEKSGFGDVKELGELERIEVQHGYILGLPFLGEHGDLDIRGRIAHLVKLKGRSLLCAADTCNVDDQLYERLANVVGAVDTLFIGMESSGAPVSYLYGPLFLEPLDRKFDQTRRLCGSNFERGIRIVQRFRCKEAYVYALGQEPWLNYFMAVNYSAHSPQILESDKFVEECHRLGVVSERLFCKKELLYSSQETRVETSPETLTKSLLLR